MCDSPVDPKAPVMLAWNAFRSTEVYENAARWATVEGNTEGSLWRAFFEGYAAGHTACQSPAAATDAAAQGTDFAFAEVSCSQCGRSFGPGNAGYSHCEDHREAQGTEEGASRE